MLNVFYYSVILYNLNPTIETGITPPQRRLPIPPLSLFSLSFSALVLNAPILPRFLAQGEVLRPLSEIDDLSSTFSKLNTTINGPRGSGIVGDRGSREGSSVAEWPHGEEVPYWLGQQALETESVPRDKHWSSQLSPNLDSKHLCRTSSYPEQQQNQHFSTEPILVFYFDFLFFSCV
ncbi:hypothetical protein ES319_D09G002600v1 [Gossypium barbadense]|uniref:Uncharacterized protein n=2 Tax=Gossypium TaxID=3633 RepID=A0A5J5PXE6_GOSBA|nr:hypothetical protein ES319_D09G002600v1 [Gossypium barbadense]TYG52122.1 hypothetical protein ES288_D09G003000v1 [Gossypium darwinii]